jgi:hypothetical protein
MAVFKKQPRGHYNSAGIAESYNAYKTYKLLSSEILIYIIRVGL